MKVEMFQKDPLKYKKKYHFANEVICNVRMGIRYSDLPEGGMTLYNTEPKILL